MVRTPVMGAMATMEAMAVQPKEAASTLLLA